MRSTRLLTAAATTFAGIALLAAPAAAGELQDPSQLPPPPPPPTMTVSDATEYEANGSIAFHVDLSEPAPPGMIITTSITHEDTDDADFVPVLVGNIGAGDTEYTIHVGLADDDGVEDVENFVLNVENNAGYDVQNSSADGFILDGNGPQMEIIDVSAPEGDPGDDNQIDVVVQASYAPLEDLTFRLYTGVFGFEATPGEDYEHIDQIVTLPAGETSVSTPIPIVEDLLDEPTELLPVYAGDSSAGDFGLDGGSGIMRILDDDEPGDDAPQPGDGDDSDDGQPVPDATPGDDTPDATTPTTADDDAEVLAAGSTRTGDLARTGDEASIGWIVGALLVAIGSFFVVLSAARRRRRPAHLRP